MSPAESRRRMHFSQQFRWRPSGLQNSSALQACTVEETCSSQQLVNMALGTKHRGTGTGTGTKHGRSAATGSANRSRRRDLKLLTRETSRHCLARTAPPQTKSAAAGMAARHELSQALFKFCDRLTPENLRQTETVSLRRKRSKERAAKAAVRRGLIALHDVYTEAKSIGGFFAKAQGSQSKPPPEQLSRKDVVCSHLVSFNTTRDVASLGIFVPAESKPLLRSVLVQKLVLTAFDMQSTGAATRHEDEHAGLDKPFHQRWSQL